MADMKYTAKDSVFSLNPYLWIFSKIQTLWKSKLNMEKVAVEASIQNKVWISFVREVCNNLFVTLYGGKKEECTWILKILQRTRVS